jgi:hypothetical protein
LPVKLKVLSRPLSYLGTVTCSEVRFWESMTVALEKIQVNLEGMH